MKDSQGNVINISISSELKCSKKALNKIIFYTSSRYNACKKADVISDIIYHVEEGRDGVFIYESGVYTESGYRDNRSYPPNDKYTLEIKDGRSVLYNFTPDSYRQYPDTNAACLLLKPQKNIYYTPAKKVLYKLDKLNPESKGAGIGADGVKTYWGVPEGYYDVYGQNKDSFFIKEKDGFERHIEKKYCTICAEGK